MIGLLQLGKIKGYEDLQGAMESALASGCSGEAAGRYLLTVEGEDRPPTEAMEVGWLGRYERPLPAMNEYDELLAVEVAR